MSGRRTRWTIEHDALLGQVQITLETTDPAVVAAVEQAAAAHGIALSRVLDAFTPEEEERACPGP